MVTNWKEIGLFIYESLELLVLLESLKLLALLVSWESW